MINIISHPQGYTTLSKVLTDNDVIDFRNYFRWLEYFKEIQTEKGGNGPFKEAANRYGDIVGESLLLYMQPFVEKAIKKTLLPTYSFLRKYHTGAELKRHRDRHSCEISCTLTIDFNSNFATEWPIHIKINDNEIPVNLSIGEGLIYYGCRTEHWRNKFEGEYSTHAFLHYVDANGRNKEYEYDKRSMIYGKQDFRKILKARLFTLEQLDQFNLQTLVKPIIPLPYKVEEKNERHFIHFDNRKHLEILYFMKPFLDNLFQQSSCFRLEQIPDRIFDQAAIDLLKKLILNGYFEIVSN